MTLSKIYEISRNHFHTRKKSIKDHVYNNIHCSEHIIYEFETLFGNYTFLVYIFDSEHDKREAELYRGLYSDIEKPIEKYIFNPLEDPDIFVNWKMFLFLKSEYIKDVSSFKMKIEQIKNYEKSLGGEGRYFEVESDMICEMQKLMCWPCKKYILENWEKVKDWSELSINLWFYGSEDVYYNSPYDDNPLKIKSIDDVVLSEDGDFYLTIDGKTTEIDYDYDRLMKISLYIEDYLLLNQF